MASLESKECTTFSQFSVCMCVQQPVFVLYLFAGVILCI